MFGLDLGKYRTIVISIALFLLFDLGVLVLNFFISSEIARDALNVNLAGRQRMLSQRTAKVALQLEDRALAGANQDKEIKELKGAFGVFDGTLTAFRNGGQTVSGTGVQIFVSRIDDDKAQAILAEAGTIWRPYRATIESVLGKTSASVDEAAALARQAEGANLGLLKLMNDLTSRVEELAASKATILRGVQVAGITLATINFLVILFHFVRHLRENDRAIERARNETDNILRTTQEGLFLLDAEMRLGSQVSTALGGIIGNAELVGRNFLDLLRPLVTEKTLNTTREYVELLQKHDVKEKLVASLNPLDCVEINVAKGAGDVDTRYLKFHFNRVLEDGKVTHLLVTANDISRAVRLERELKATEERAKGQIGLLVEILQVEPSAMQQFLRSADEGLNQVNALLRDQDAIGVPAAGKVNAIYRVAHRIKGDASGLGLKGLAASFHELEDVLSVLRERADVKGEDFLPVTVRVKGLFEELEAISSAVTRMAQVRSAVTVEPQRPQHDGAVAQRPFVHQWQAMADQIGERQGKRAEVHYNGIDIQSLPTSLGDAITSIVNQLIRNALVHGIEAPTERQCCGKSEVGHLSVYVSRREDGGVDLSFRDDGQGVSVPKVRDAALRKGLISAEEAAQADPRRIVALIFEPGMSTREHSDEDAGRGAGLDAVKDLVIRQGGGIRLGSTPGEYCHFRMTLAAKPVDLAPDAIPPRLDPALAKAAA